MAGPEDVMNSHAASLIDDPAVYRRVFLDSTDAIVITDTGGRILAANRAWCELYGYSLDEVRGRTTAIIKSPHTTDEMYKYMWSQISDSSKGFWKGEIVNRTRGGEEVVVLLTITPIRAADGALAGYMGIGIDMTERRRLDEMRELYAVIVQHDLRAPLSSILALLGTLLDGYLGPIGEKQRAILERVQRAGGRMQEMIATSLDFGKLKHGVLRLEMADVDLFAVARDSCATLAEPAGQREVTIQMCAGDRQATAGDRLVVRTDPIHLQRCTDNLLKNAIEASPRAGVVTVTVTCREEERTARIRFHNGGPPIPPDVRATLFHPYSTFGKRGGTGLGVTGVKMAVEAMGGTVSYETGDHGTSFEIVLPLAGPAEKNE